jgi:hypothetical protein
MRAAKRLAVVVLVAAVSLAGWEWFRRAAYASLSYGMEARFATLPADDKSLCWWPKAQPASCPAQCSSAGKGRTVGCWR